MQQEPQIRRIRSASGLIPAVAAGLCLAAASLVVCPLRADEPATIAALVEQLKRANPQLEQARQAWLAAQLEVPQADSLPGAQLDLLEQANTGGAFDFNRNSGFFAYPSLSQPLPWPGKLRLAGEVARAQADVAGRQYDALLIQLVAQLRLACYQWLALRDQLRFLLEDLQRLEQVKEIARVRYANNAAAYVDFLNAQVSASSLENDRFALQRQIQQQGEQINTLIGRSSQAELTLEESMHAPELPAQSLPALIDLAMKTNPAVAGGESQIEAADKSVALAHKGFLPDFTVSVGAYTAPELVHPQTTRLYSVGVSLSLPTWGFRKEKAALGQAQAQLAEAKAGQQANRQQIELGVAAAYHGLETALQQLRFTRERLLPQAQMAYRLALTAYGSGGGTVFQDLLTAQGGLRSTELALVQAQNSALQDYVSLEAAIGTDPGEASR